MSTLSFDSLLRHVGHAIACRAHGLPPQNVIIHCATCDEWFGLLLPSVKREVNS